MYEKNKIYSIHFLRFFASLAVLIFHGTGVGSAIVVGGAGVDIFFVISGIVIGLTISSGDSAKNFALKRLIRVMPLYWLATIAIILVEYYSWRVWPTTEQTARSVFLFPAFGTDWSFIYFPGWTLAYEMLFYIVATMALFAFRRNARAATLVIFAALAVIRIRVPGATALPFIATDMFLEFCAGLVISEIIARGIVANRKLGYVCVVLALALFWNNQTFTLPRPVAWGVPSVMLVIGAMSFESVGWLKNKWVVLGGDASYSMYLTHVSTFLAIETFAFKHSIPYQDHFIITSIVKIVIAVAVGVLVHKWIERPVLTFLRGMLLPKKRSRLVMNA